MENIESYEYFSIVTYYPFLVNNKLIGDPTAGKAALNAVLNAENMRSAITAFYNVSSMHSIENNGITNKDLIHVNKTLLNNHLLSKVVDVFMLSQLTSIDFHISDESSVPDVYFSKFGSIAAYTYTAVRSQFKNICQGNSGSSDCSRLVNNEITHIIKAVETIRADLLLNITDDHASTFNEYLEKIFVKFTTNTFNVDLSVYELRLLFCCSTPLLYIIYYSYYVPTKSIQSGFDNNNRKFTVKKDAILNIYKVVLYTLYTLYKSSVMIQPYASVTTQIQQIYDAFLNNVIMPELLSSAVEKNTYKKTYKNKLAEYKENSQLLDQNKRQIEFLRSEIINVLNVRDSYKKRSKKYALLTWITFAFVLIYIIAGIVLSILSIEFVNYYFIVVSYILVIACLITYMIYLIYQK